MSVNTLTVSFTPPSPVPANGYRLNYRPIGSVDPYTTYTDPLATTSISVTLLDGAITGYEGTVEAVCGPGYYSTVVSFTSNVFCQCPPGFTAVGTNDNCQQVISEPAALNGGGVITACHYTKNVYGQYGTVFYKPGGYATNGTFTITPSYIKTAAIGGVHVGTLWANPAGTLTGGRLNNAGIWKCGDQNYTGTLGFSRQLVISSTKTYYIGLGSDNYATIKINGVTIVSQDASALGASLAITAEGTFKYWHVYPVELTAGVNLLEMTGTNLGLEGIMGCEIYDATEAQLIACTTEAELLPYIVFTTDDMAGIPSGSKVIDTDPFEVGSYNCSAFPGYNLVFQGGSYQCKLIQNTPCGSDIGL